jgi:hypothetical protein
LKKRCVQKPFAYFGRFFLLIKSIYPAHIPPAAYSTTWLDCLDMPRLCVDTIHCTQTVCGHCT